MNPLAPRGFLLVGGIILVALGVLGMFLLGPTPGQSMVGEFFWLDDVENYAHLILGVVALGAYYLLKDEMLTKWLVILVGVVALLATILGFMNSGGPVPNLGVTNLEAVSDNILHLVVTVWALYAGFVGGKSTSGGAV